MWRAFHFALAGQTECLVELLMRKCCLSDESWGARASGHFLPGNPPGREEAVQAAPAILALGVARGRGQQRRTQSRSREEPGLTPAVALRQPSVP